MEQLKKIKKFLLAILTLTCMLVLVLDLVLFTMKKTSDRYIKEEKIKEIVNNINVIDLFKDKNGKELEEFTEIKDKFVEAGIPKEGIDEFINSSPVNDYASITINKSIDNVLKNKKEKVVTANSLNLFFEKNMSNISKELQEKKVPKSELLTKENQEKLINKIKEKTPYIEEKFDEINNKINEKLGFNYTLKLEKIFKIIKLLYTKLMDILLLVIFIIFVIGIFITRQSLYKGFKWLGITFLSSGIILYSINFIIPKTYKYLEKIPSTFSNFIKFTLNDVLNIFNKYSMVFVIIGFILIIINIIIYFVLLKYENKKFKNIG